jgi:drug/metabolite transporter (DMT)-like permease
MWAHLALFLVAAIYGANYSIAKIVLDDGFLRPNGFILLRVLVGASLFTLAHRLFIREGVQRTDWPLLALCGLFGVAINQLLFFQGLHLTSPIHASLIMTTTPILVLVASVFLLKEPIGVNKLLGIFLGAAGAVWLILHSQGSDFGHPLGDFFVFINASSYGVYLVLVKRLMLRYHPFTVVRWVFTFGLLFVLPFGLSDLAQTSWASFSEEAWWAVAYVLLFTTFVAYLFNASAMVVVSPSVVGMYIYLQPVLAAWIALAMGKDQLDWIEVMAAMLIFGGVFLVSARRKKPVLEPGPTD